MNSKPYVAADVFLHMAHNPVLVGHVHTSSHENICLKCRTILFQDRSPLLIRSTLPAQRLLGTVKVTKIWTGGNLDPYRKQQGHHEGGYAWES